MSMSTKDVAAELETTPRSLRKFLRKAGLGVGQGSRYAFDADDMDKIRARYDAYLAEKAAAVEAAKVAREAEEAADDEDEDGPEDEG